VSIGRTFRLAAFRGGPSRRRGEAAPSAQRSYSRESDLASALHISLVRTQTFPLYGPARCMAFGGIVARDQHSDA